MSLPNELAATEDFEFAALSAAKNYRAALIREFRPWLRGKALEIGAGIGQMTAELLRITEINQLASVEPDSRFFNRLHSSLPEQRAIQGTIDDVPDWDWDAVLSVNVLEHIEDDQGELGKYRAKLAQKSGFLCLLVPARPEIYAPIDKDFGHFRRYIKSELLSKLDRAGFMVVKLRYYNLIGYFAWWWTFCVLRKRKFNAGAVRFFDRVIFPPAHHLESAVGAPPFGQSLLVTAQACS